MVESPYAVAREMFTLSFFLLRKKPADSDIASSSVQHIDTHSGFLGGAELLSDAPFGFGISFL